MNFNMIVFNKKVIFKTLKCYLVCLVNIYFLVMKLFKPCFYEKLSIVHISTHQYFCKWVSCTKITLQYDFAWEEVHYLPLFWLAFEIER